MSTFWTPRYRVAWILIFIAALNGLGWTIFRWAYEDSMTQAQITLDYDDTRVMSDAFGVPHEKFLRELKKRGVTSLGIYEQSLANFRDNGRLSLLTREEAQALYPQADWKSYPDYYRYVATVPTEDQALTWQILNRLRNQETPGAPTKTVVLKAPPTGQPRNAGLFGIMLPASKQVLNDAQMGFDPEQVKLCKKLGLVVTARLSNTLNMNLPRAKALLDDAKNAGAKVVIFADDEAMGYDSMIPDVAREMRKRGLYYGNIEFSKQLGWQQFAAKSDGQLVRVHSVGPDEAAKWQPEALTERFSRAVKERDIRVAYIRLLRHFKGEYRPVPGAPKSADPRLKLSALEQNYDFVAGISKELQHQPLPFKWLRPGMTLGAATPFGNYPIDQLGGGIKASVIRYIGLFISSLGLIGAVLLLLNLSFDWNEELQKRRLILGFIFVIGLLGLDILSGLAKHGGILRIFGMWPSMFGVKLMATCIGCLFPVIGILWGGLPRIWDNFDEGNKSYSRAPKVEVLPAWITGVKVLLTSSALMMIGPLLIITLLNHWKFFSLADKFFFPKITQLVPLLLVGLAFSGEAFPHRVMVEGAVAARLRAKHWFKNLLDQPFTARIAVYGLILLIVGFVWIARTGNDSGMQVSSLELKMRALLEQVFITRPRTKELFLGHPAMIFAVYFAMRRNWLLAFGAMFVATIGQADMLNTFCHLHTPLFYSLLRSIHAVWLGALIGGGALWVFHKLTTPKAFTRFKAERRPLPKQSADEGSS